MQPDRSQNEWQQPKEQPSKAPYVANPDMKPISLPVVTLASPQEGVTDSRVPLAPSLQVQETGSNVSPEEDGVSSSQMEEQPLHWQANEYAQHDKTPIWFVLFGVVTIVLMAIAIFFVHSVTFTILVPVMAVALIVYTNRPPRLIDYTLSRQGLHVHDQLYPFTDFKSFGVIHDGKDYFIMLIPVKRFRPGVSVYFPEESGESIVDMLGARLPMRELHLDMVDTIIHKLRI